MRLLLVLAEEAGRQSILRVIGLAHALFDAVDLGHEEDRQEQFVLDQRVILRQAGDDGRLDVIAVRARRRPSACCRRRAPARRWRACGDVPLVVFVGALVDHRAHKGRPRAWDRPL